MPDSEIESAGGLEEPAEAQGSRAGQGEGLEPEIIGERAPKSQRIQRASPRTGEEARRKRLLIHAGVHKTGSTAIQNLLSSRRANLESQGIAYPPGDAAREESHPGIVWALNRGDLTGTGLAEWLRQVVPSDCDTIILSAEDFCRLHDVRFLAGLQRVYDVEVIFYLRRQDHWVTSWYNQEIRWPFDPTLAATTPLEFLNYLGRFHWLQYFKLLERWAAFLGREKIRVRVFEKGQAADPVRDFLELVGARLDRQTLRANESISAEKLELLRRLRFIRFRPAERMKMLAALECIPNKRSTNVYCAGVRRLLIDRYAAQNQLVAQHYLGRLDGGLFLDESFPEEEAAVGESPSLDEELVLQVIRTLASDRERRQ